MGKAKAPPAKRIPTTQKDATHNAAASSSSPKSLTVPSASALKLIPKKERTRAPSKLPDIAPIETTVRQYTGCAKDLVSAFPADAPLWQIQCTHDAYPNSYLREIIGALNDFLAQLHEENNTWPTNVHEMRDSMDAIVTLTGDDDPMSVGFLKWRVAFYIAGNLEALHNFLNMLDDFFVWRQTHPRARETTFAGDTIWNIRPHIDIDLAGVVADFTFHTAHCHEPTANLPLNVFEAQPPVGKKVVAASFEFPDETHVTIIWSGSLWVYRDRFEESDVQLSQIQEGARSEYVRVLLNAELPSAAQQIRDIFGDNVLKKVVCRCVCHRPPPANSEASNLLETLQENHQLCW